MVRTSERMKLTKDVYKDLEEIKKCLVAWGISTELQQPIENISKIVGYWNEDFGAYERVVIYYKNGDKQEFEFEW